MEEQSKTVRINDNFVGFHYSFVIVVIIACVVVGVLFLIIAFSEDPDVFSSIIPEGLAILVSIVPAALIVNTFKPKVLRKFFVSPDEIGFRVPSQQPFTISWHQFDSIQFLTQDRSQVGTRTEFRFLDLRTQGEQTFYLFLKTHFRTIKFAKILYAVKFNADLQKKTMVAIINDKKLKRILAQLYEIQIFGRYARHPAKDESILPLANMPSSTPESSIDALEKAVESDPMNGKIWQALGEAYYQKGLSDLANEALNEAYKVSTNWFLSSAQEPS